MSMAKSVAAHLRNDGDADGDSGHDVGHQVGQRVLGRPLDDGQLFQQRLEQLRVP